MTNFMNMIRDESGASAAEYALILAIIGSVVALAAITLGDSIGGAMTDAAQCIDGTNPECQAEGDGGGADGGGETPPADTTTP